MQQQPQSIYTIGLSSNIIASRDLVERFGMFANHLPKGVHRHILYTPDSETAICAEAVRQVITIDTSIEEIPYQGNSDEIFNYPYWRELVFKKLQQSQADCLFIICKDNVIYQPSPIQFNYANYKFGEALVFNKIGLN